MYVERSKRSKLTIEIKMLNNVDEIEAAIPAIVILAYGNFFPYLI